MLKEQTKSKLKTPFFFTYLTVVALRNWDLIFTLFNFDKGNTREQKLDIICLLISDSIILDSLINILISLGILIVSYLLLAISRTITDGYNFRILPWISRLTNSKRYLEKHEYEERLKELHNVKTLLNQEQKITSEQRQEINNLKENLKTFLASENATKNVPENKLKNMAGKLTLKKLADEFLSIGRSILKGNHLDNDSFNTTPFLEMGLIEVKAKARNSTKYNFKGYGEQLFRYIIDLQD